MGGGAGFGSRAAADFSDLFGSGFGDIFGKMFGGGFGGFGGGFGTRSRDSSAPTQGDSLRYNLELSFKEAAFGTKADLKFKHEETCTKCSGSGAAAGSKRVKCPSCNGTGQTVHSAGFFSIAQTCPDCGGAGTKIEKPCPACRGRGTDTVLKHITLTIPAGTENGRKMVLRGMGNAGANGGPAGDLVVVVSVAPHKFFERHENDIYCVVPVSFSQAMLGAKITVPGLDGNRVDVNIPAGSQNDSFVVVKGAGIPYANSSSRGNMHIKLQIEMPKHLNSEQKLLLEKFAKIENSTTKPEPIPLSSLR